MKTRTAAPVVLALTLALAPALVGCSMVEGQVEGVIEEATGGEVDLPGTELPEGFPAEVPLIDGEIAFGVALGNGYNVSVRVDGPEAMDDIAAQLEGAGFEAQVGGTTGEGATQAFSSDAYSVLVVISKENETDYLANYTVAPVQ
jgi:hypothetical protein